jgi:hypothetical protein
MALGPHRISRLVAGWNPIGGTSIFVGMYPRFTDEVGANARYAREFARPTGA